MSAVFGERLTLGQAKGPDVELRVWGDEWYAHYETVSGYSAVYDDELGLFCYAQLAGGEFQSTKVPVTEAPPPGAERHAWESDSVRAAKAAKARDLRASRHQGDGGTPIQGKE